MSHIIREMNQAYGEVVKNQQLLKEGSLVEKTEQKSIKPKAIASTGRASKAKNSGGVTNAVRKAAGLEPTEYEDISDMDNESKKEEKEKALKRAAKMIAVMQQNEMGLLQGDEELTKEEFYYAIGVLMKEGLAKSNAEALHLINVFESTDSRLIDYIFE